MRTRCAKRCLRAAAFSVAAGLLAATNAGAALRPGPETLGQGQREGPLQVIAATSVDTLSLYLIAPLQRGLSYGTAAGDCRQSRDIERKVQGCTRLIERDGANAIAYFRRAEAYQELEHHDAAIADFDAAIRLDPAYASAYLGLGRSRQASGDLAGAIGDFTAAIRLNPVLARAYVGRGAALELSGRLPEAMADYRAALSLDAGFEEASAALARLEEAAGRR
ncbi:MAG: tetratricopeptide repeat protein [Hyphomicrobiaceae bacterium]|nr:MAG: tetratricopeptide repeat protein [Hyphomicrobiaceae bacterium]